MQIKIHTHAPTPPPRTFDLTGISEAEFNYLLYAVSKTGRPDNPGVSMPSSEEVYKLYCRLCETNAK